MFTILNIWFVVNNWQAGIIALLISDYFFMESIRQILADNMKEYRKKRGYSQVKLAEQAGVSAQYIAMIEMCSKFPKPEMLERLARALDIETHHLFGVSTTPEEALTLLRQDIVSEMGQLTANVERVVAKGIKEALADNCKGCPPVLK